jgi:type II protein arginine methyltransferase
LTDEAASSETDDLMTMAVNLVEAGMGRKAVRLIEQALETAWRPELLWLLRRIQSENVPEFHFEMLLEDRRNAVFEQALARAVTPGCSVLDIGSGTGLLAMMAARAGAAHVTTCEMDWRLAETARRIVEANGYSDRVNVLNVHSSSLEVGRDLPERVDVLVAEIFGHMLLNEAVLPVFEHAREHLLKPGGTIIPAAASFEIALAEDSNDLRGPVGDIRGFDVSGINRHRPIGYSIPVGDEALALRSDPVSLFSFDFTCDAAVEPGEREISLRSSGGRVNGVVGWIRLALDDTDVYENRPGPGASSSWRAPLWRMPPVDTQPGDLITVRGKHDRYRIWIGAPDGTPWFARD